jgi:hypothetical protein
MTDTAICVRQLTKKYADRGNAGRRCGDRPGRGVGLAALKPSISREGIPTWMAGAAASGSRAGRSRLETVRKPDSC